MRNGLHAMSARAAIAAASGTGVGVLAALAALYGSHAHALALFLGASAASVAVLAFVASVWLDAARPPHDTHRAALVVFLLSVGLGLMLGAGAHGGHG
ncbi:MAG: hypothetical protein M3327_08545 [Actinomycetota bacterium]|nr:hypothetical protein [Actinomycetota bacterium]